MSERERGSPTSISFDSTDSILQRKTINTNTTTAIRYTRYLLVAPISLCRSLFRVGAPLPTTIRRLVSDSRSCSKTLMLVVCHLAIMMTDAYMDTLATGTR
jgi:hypothetical protein